MMTLSEENYIKTIYHLSKDSQKGVSTNAIAQSLQTKASSVTDMLKRLSDKQWVIYKKYQGVLLSEEGKKHALKVIRKHRLWEVFLVEKLHFSWDEVHEIAEQLEHIQSDKLVEKLDIFLGFPTTDPHGDPIPDRNGKISTRKKMLLSELPKQAQGICVGVKNTSKDFLQYLSKMQIAIGNTIQVIDIEPFDGSYLIQINEQQVYISALIAQNIYIQTNQS